MLKYHYAQPKEVGFAKYSFNEHNGRSDNVRPNGGVVLDSYFIQIRTHQQHVYPLPAFRAGEFLRTSRVLTLVKPESG